MDRLKTEYTGANFYSSKENEKKEKWFYNEMNIGLSRSDLEL